VAGVPVKWHELEPGTWLGEGLDQLAYLVWFDGETGQVRLTRWHPAPGILPHREARDLIEAVTHLVSQAPLRGSGRPPLVADAERAIRRAQAQADRFNVGVSVPELLRTDWLNPAELASGERLPATDGD
jgi:hypothetical protein